MMNAATRVNRTTLHKASLLTLMVACMAALLFLVAGSSAAAPGGTTRVSVDTAGNQAQGGSVQPSVSFDGRYVVFSSPASNLVANDTNNSPDIFVRDRDADFDKVFDEPGAVFTKRVNVTSAGTQANATSIDPSVSSGGRCVAFSSVASNLVPNDTNGSYDVFVTVGSDSPLDRVSVATSGTQALRGISRNPSISSDCRFVAFSSSANDLVPNDTNRSEDIFVRDRLNRTTERVSVDTAGNQAAASSANPSISSDGRFVTFSSNASNLVANDTNGTTDIFVRDRLNRTTERVSVTSTGTQADALSVQPSISSGGRYVVFSSSASNLVANDTNNAPDIFVRDRDADADGVFDEAGAVFTERVNIATSGNQAAASSANPSISSDGRVVTFSSSASNLVPSDTNGSEDIFVRDRLRGATKRVSVASSATQANATSFDPFISGDGRYVAFSSDASNLVPNDTNGTDVFVHELTWLDSAPPTISVPADVTVDATSPDGAEVTYTVTAADELDPNPAVSCDPESGTIFPIGTTTVKCTATDASGNTANASFNVTIVDVTAPSVEQVTPAEGATGIALGTNLVAAFSEPMDKSTLTQETFKLYKVNRDGTIRQIRDVTVTPSSDGLRVKLDPYGTSTTLLARNTRYKAEVSTGAKDPSGNPLDQDASVSSSQPKVWSFKTRT